MVRVHGNTIVPERTDGVLVNVAGVGGTDRAGSPRGWGRTFRFHSGRGTWFHLSVDTHDRESRRGANVPRPVLRFLLIRSSCVLRH